MIIPYLEKPELKLERGQEVFVKGTVIGTTADGRIWVEHWEDHPLPYLPGDLAITVKES